MIQTLSPYGTVDIEQIVLANARGSVRDTVFVELQAAAEDSTRYVNSPNFKARTLGNWVLTYDGRDLRPDQVLDFGIVDKMKQSGICNFALLMKLAMIMTTFRGGYGWKVTSPDDELVEVATAALRRIISRMFSSGGYHSLTDGAAFMELRWESLTKYQLGLSKNKGATKEFTVPKLPNFVDPRTIKAIQRKDGGKFNGFIQQNNYWGQQGFPGVNEIIVPRKDSFILTYGEEFGNLWGNSFYAPMYAPWFWYELVLRALVRWSERMGLPLLVGEAPMRETIPDPENPGQTMKALDYMALVAASAAFSNYATIPTDRDRETSERKYDLRYLPSGENPASAFVSILQELAQLILRSALSADRALTQSSGGVGSYNIGELHAAATSLHNQMILTNWIWAMNQYFMPWFSLFNRGEGGPPIMLEVQALDPDYRNLLQGMVSTLANSKPGAEALWNIDFRTIMELGQIPTLSEKEVEELKQKYMDEALENQKAMLDLQGPAPSDSAGTSAANSEQESARRKAEQDNAKGDNGDSKTIANEAYDQLVEVLLEGGEIPLIVNESEIILRRKPPKFREKDHPRNRRGRFTSRGSGGGGRAQTQTTGGVGVGNPSKSTLAYRIKIQKDKAGGIGVQRSAHGPFSTQFSTRNFSAPGKGFKPEDFGFSPASFSRAQKVVDWRIRVYPSSRGGIGASMYTRGPLSARYSEVNYNKLGTPLLIARVLN